MKVFILDTYYDRFLDRIERDPVFRQADHDGRMDYLVRQRFGTSDYYQRNLQSLGHQASETIANCVGLQSAWANEHGTRRPKGRAGLLETLTAQVKDESPDILYVQDMNWTPASWLRSVREHVDLVVGQTAYPLTAGVDLGPYDLITTSFPHYVRMFRRMGIPSELLRIGFDSIVLDEIGPQARTHSATFVGGYTTEHGQGTKLLETVAQEESARFWGYGVESLPRDSPIRRAHQGEAWGIEMYRIMAQSRIALNRHIRTSGRTANNMRLYEATGMGAALLTDAKDDLAELFEPGEEVITYTDADDCRRVLRQLLNDPALVEDIGKAGQKRTLKDHTYRQRMEDLIRILEGQLDSQGAMGHRCTSVEPRLNRPDPIAWHRASLR